MRQLTPFVAAVISNSFIALFSGSHESVSDDCPMPNLQQHKVQNHGDLGKSGICLSFGNGDTFSFDSRRRWKARQAPHVCASLLLIHLGGCVVKVKARRDFSFLIFLPQCHAPPLTSLLTFQLNWPSSTFILRLFEILLAPFVAFSTPTPAANIDIKKSHHVA